MPEYHVIYHPKDFPAFHRMYNETFANMSEDDYLLYYRGPKYLPLAFVIPITIIYSIIFITGIIGNSLVCIVIFRNANMHTATNFYLFSLAVSDLTLLLLGLPNDLLTYWEQYPWRYGLMWCRARAVLSETCSYSSVLVIVAFSAERYMAVCKPFHTYQISTLTRARWVIAIVWMVSFIAASPIAYYTSVDYLYFPPEIGGRRLDESAFCALLEEDYKKRGIPIYELSSIFFFMIPMIVIGVMYWKITKTLTERDRSGIRRQYGNPDVITRKSILRMLGAVVVAFFCCWAPFHLQRLIFLHMTTHPNYQIVNEWLYYVTGCFYYFSATVNPILYSLMSARFREAFRTTLLCYREDLGMDLPPRERCPKADILLQRFGNADTSGDSFQILTSMPTPVETPNDAQNNDTSSRIPQYDSQTTIGIDDNAGSTIIDIESPIISIYEYEEAVCHNTIVQIENDSSVFNSNDNSPRSDRTICELLPRSFSIPFPETKIPTRETYI